MTDTPRCDKCKRREMAVWLEGRPLCQPCFEKEIDTEPARKPNGEPQAGLMTVGQAILC